MIGTLSSPSSNGSTNEIAIGYKAVGSGSNTVVIGNNDITNTYLKGSVTTTGAFTGSLFGTSSWANNAVTSSYVLNAVSASYLSGSTAIVTNLTSSNDALINGLTVGKGSGNGFSNTIVGLNAFVSNSAGHTSIVLGGGGLRANTTGYRNVAIGSNVLLLNTTGIENIGISAFALLNNNGNGNIAIGLYSTTTNTTGNYNVGLGNYTNYEVSSGGYNTSIGYNTGRGITTGNYNTIVGAQVTGLAAGLNNNIILADGQGNIKYRWDGAQNTISGSLNVTGGAITGSDALFTGTLTAQTIVVQTITSSTDFVTGSTRFGSLLSNTHQFTGSVSITGSLDVNGSSAILSNQTSSMSVATASFAPNIYNTDGTLSSNRIVNLNDKTLTFSNINNVYFTSSAGTFISLQASSNTAFVSMNYYDSGSNLVGGWGYGNSNVISPVYRSKIYFAGVNVPYSIIMDSVETSRNYVNGNVKIQTGGTYVDNGYKLQVTAQSTSSGSLWISGSSVMSGSLTVTQGITGSLFGTASWAQNAVTASYISASGVVGLNLSQISTGSVTASVNAGSNIFNIVSGSNTLVVVDNTGSVGIGTTSPAYKLDVNGTARVSGLLYGDSYIHAGGTNQIRIGASGGERSIYSSGDFYVYAGGVVTAQYRSSQTQFKSKILIQASINSGDRIGLFNGITLAIPGASYANEIIGYQGGGDATNAFVIRTSDNAYSQNVKHNIYVYGGLNTSFSSYGDLVLQHDGTNKRGDILIGGTTSNSSAIVNIQSTTQGFLPPRMTAAQRIAISSPARGLLVYDIDSTTEGLWLYNSGSTPGWQEVLTNTGSQSILGGLTATSFTGSLFGTASWAQNAVTSSYILQAVSSSFASTASYALNGGVTQIVAGTNVTISPTSGTGSVTINATAGASFPFTGSALITGSLTVTGSISTTSTLNIGNSQFNNTSSVTTAGTTIVSSIATSSFNSAFYNYYIMSASNARAGQIMSVWSGSTVRYTEVTTTDIGNTATASFAVALSGANVNLSITAPGVWTVKSIANLL